MKMPVKSPVATQATTKATSVVRAAILLVVQIHLRQIVVLIFQWTIWKWVHYVNEDQRNGTKP